MLVCQILIGTD